MRAPPSVEWSTAPSLGKTAPVTILIQRLRAQHQSVQQQLRGLEEALARHDLPGVQRLLPALQDALLTHLGAADRELYPRLERIQGRSGDAAWHTFLEGMTQLTFTVAAFLQAAPALSDEAAFTHAWRPLADKIALRMAAEELVLFPLFATANQPPGAVSRPAELLN